jgi:hypothetical protein
MNADERRLIQNVGDLSSWQRESSNIQRPPPGIQQFAMLTVGFSPIHEDSQEATAGCKRGILSPTARCRRGILSPTASESALPSAKGFASYMVGIHLVFLQNSSSRFPYCVANAVTLVFSAKELETGARRGRGERSRASGFFAPFATSAIFCLYGFDCGSAALGPFAFIRG